MLDSMYETMSISSGLYPNLDLWNANKLQLQLQLQISKEPYRTICHHFHPAKYLISDAVKKILSHPKLNIYQYI